jgi:hypothetical protein
MTSGRGVDTAIEAACRRPLCCSRISSRRAAPSPKSGCTGSRRICISNACGRRTSRSRPGSWITDTLALGSAAPGPSEHSAQRRFQYGWLRGAGSAAFICGTLLSGQAISRFGITAAVWLNAGLLAAKAVAARLVPVLLLPTKDGTRPMMADGAVCLSSPRASSTPPFRRGALPLARNLREPNSKAGFSTYPIKQRPAASSTTQLYGGSLDLPTGLSV